MEMGLPDMNFIAHVKTELTSAHNDKYLGVGIW